jgi:uncharacterized membrane protein YphA (DoxX/SURF4 family)
MNTALWIVQGILAAAFIMAGLMKLSQPADKLVKAGQAWAGRVTASTLKFIGLMEFLGAIGLILPNLLHIAPVLTPVAASALALVQVLAMINHARAGEKKEIAFNIVLLVMTAFVAYGRF